jgi:hypothetical protein
MSTVENDYPANTYMTDLLASETADYITERAADARAVLRVLSFTAPHGPLQATQQYFDFVDQNIPGLTGNRRTYAAMMVAMDMGVQTVLDRLDDPDQDGDTADSITGDTLICFINDNGGETANSARNFPLRGKKSDTFDGGIRVMMTMAGPGVPATGASYDFPVDSADLLPTFARRRRRPARAGRLHRRRRSPPVPRRHRSPARPTPMSTSAGTTPSSRASGAATSGSSPSRTSAAPSSTTSSETRARTTSATSTSRGSSTSSPTG